LNILIGSVYLPQLSPCSLYMKHCESIFDAITTFIDPLIYLFGDFNLPHVTWNNDTSCISTDILSGASNTKRSSLDIIYLYFNPLNLTQRNFIVNNQNNVLDLIFTNDWRARVTHPAEYLLASDGYHPLLEISSTLPRLGNPSPPSFQKYNFRLANYFSMRNYFNYFNLICWDDEMQSMDLNTSVLFLTSHIIHALNLFIPKKLCYKSSYPVWYSSELKALVRKKKCAHKRFKKSSNYNDYLSFTYYRKKCKALPIGL